MEKELKEKIAKYVDRVGVKTAEEVAEITLTENSNGIDKYGNPDELMARLKFNLAVIEYLHCDSDNVDKYLEIIV